MLFAKRTAIIEIIFAARLNRPPFPSLSAAVGPPLSSLLYLFGFQNASFNTHLSVASLYSHRRCHFLLFVPLFSCHFPVSAALLCHFSIISFVFAPCHSHFLSPLSFSLMHTKKFPLSEVCEVREKALFPESTKIRVFTVNK